MTITNVAHGGVSDIMEPREVVLRTAADLQQLWRQHGAGQAPPSVDFTTRMVVGVFLGSRVTGGFDVQITGVEASDGALVVRYIETKPAPGAMLAQVITAPFHLVSVEKFDGPVKFEKAEKRGRGKI
jgi:hypothetical protein